MNGTGYSRMMDKSSTVNLSGTPACIDYAIQVCGAVPGIRYAQRTGPGTVTFFLDGSRSRQDVALGIIAAERRLFQRI
jgi:hypothetical protein